MAGALNGYQILTVAYAAGPVEAQHFPSLETRSGQVLYQHWQPVLMKSWAHGVKIVPMQAPDGGNLVLMPRHVTSYAGMPPAMGSYLYQPLSF